MRDLGRNAVRDDMKGSAAALSTPDRRALANADP